MATRVERAGIESCIAKVNAAIEELNNAAREVNQAMNELPNYWEGAAYDKARAVYEEQYQGLLTNTVPKAVEDFRINENDNRVQSLILEFRMDENEIVIDGHPDEKSNIIAADSLTQVILNVLQAQQ